MTTKTRADIAHDKLVVLYGPGDMDYLLSKFYLDHPTSKPYGSSNWLAYIISQGATGTTHADKDLNFWTNL